MDAAARSAALQTAIPDPAPGPGRSEPTELLAPARDLACGRSAIDCGADALYVGPPRFGARAAAGNTLAEIAELTAYAHRWWVRVYAALNTLLTDAELPEALRLAHELYQAGVDGLIVQDLGLLEGGLPPLPLIASTQMHNHTPERVAFLERVGFQRVILARELSLEEIAGIRAQASTIELECFIHGALCVGYSGQCCLSYAIGGRSGNRGECAQPCRRRYDLADRAGKTLVQGQHLLSLRDLSLTDHLGELLEVGVRSFKIEGRLKDEVYVRNAVSHYRRRLDAVLAQRGLTRSSSGSSRVGFEPDPDRTFNRGYTTYFLHGRGDPPGRPETPKMIGQPVGRVVSVSRDSFVLDRPADLIPGDGLCYFDAAGEVQGALVNRVTGSSVSIDSAEGLSLGVEIRRNLDHRFQRQVTRAPVHRRIRVRLTLTEVEDGFLLEVVDEDGNRAVERRCLEKAVARSPEQALATARKQLAQTGATEFEAAGVEVVWSEPWFLPVAILNDLRRTVLEALVRARAANRPLPPPPGLDREPRFPAERLDYLGNVLNAKAAAFYRRHGVEEIEPAAESGLDLAGRKVMTARYCIRHQLGWCSGQRSGTDAEDLYLVDEDGRRLEVRFDCQACRMEVYQPARS